MNYIKNTSVINNIYMILLNCLKVIILALASYAKAILITHKIAFCNFTLWFVLQ